MPRKAKPKFRSGFEQNLAGQIRNAEGTLRYETLRLKYQRKPSTYTPDYVLKNGIVVEAKGRFTATDRTKMLLVKAQHPHLDIRLVFMNPRVRLSSISKTTYGEWATKHGFQWAERWVPNEWFIEPKTTPASDGN